LSNQQRKQVYVILSIDTEHDIIRWYETRAAGWSNGIPLLCEVFDTVGLRGKVCWLVEHNVKEGIPVANPHSAFCCNELPELIKQIKNRGDEMGLHPSMSDWTGGEREALASLYNSAEFWDSTRRYHDAQFVQNLITSATQEFKKVFGVNPVGCRTGGCAYATHLAGALEKNGIYIDSSVRKSRPWQWLKPPNAYYTTEDDIRVPSARGTMVEIPTAGYICTGWLNAVLRCRTWYWLNRRQTIFLSFFIHNWQAIRSDGSADIKFLESLTSFLNILSRNGAQFLSWAEAKEVYDSMYRDMSVL